MADTFTSKLALRQYDAGLNYDVSKLSADMLKIDNAMGAVICTSTTRPSTGLFDGMTLWETDTKSFVVRVSAAWVRVPQRIIVADQTARDAIAVKYDGMIVYRQDFDWQEIYDGAAWRVQGQMSVNALSDITNPITGQTCTLRSDNYLYRWSGSAWIAAQSLSNTSYIEYNRTANQTIPNVTLQGILFNGASPKTSVDITTATVSGGTEFTVLRAGRWLWTTNGSLNGSTGGTFRGWWLENPTTSTRHAMQGGHVSAFFAAFSVSREVTMAANEKMRVVAYHDAGAGLDTIVAQAPVNVTARYMGPT